MNTRAVRRWLPERLPPITGRLWWPFLLVWSALLACSLWTAVMCVPLIHQRATAPIRPQVAAGFGTDASSSTVIGKLVSPADPTGLQQGDQLLAINGALIGSTIAARDAQLAGPPGTTLTVTVRTRSGATRTHVLTRDPERYRRALAAAWLTPLLSQLGSLLIGFVLNVVVAIGCATLLMARRARDPVAPWASLTMLLLVLGNGLGGMVFSNLFANPDMIYAIFNSLAWPMLLLVLAGFPQGQFAPRWSLAIVALSTVQALLPLDLSLAQSNILLVLMQLGVVAAIGVRYRAMPPGIGRQQIRWALLGFAISTLSLAVLTGLQFGYAATADIAVAAWLYLFVGLFAAATTTLLILGITVSLLRYRLYDADVTISRSVVYGALTLSLLAIFAGSEKLIEILGEEYLGERLGALAGGLSAAVAAVCLVPIHHRVTHWAEHRFRSGLVKLRDGLPLLVGDMRETATPRALADAMLVRVEAGVRAQHGAVVVAGTVLDARDIDAVVVAEWLENGPPLADRAGLQADRADPLFPVRIPLHADGVGQVGWLLLGPRPDGTFYGREERAALHEIADPVARALAISLQREERAAARRDEDAARDREIGRLARLVERLQARLLPDTPANDAWA